MKKMQVLRLVSMSLAIMLMLILAGCSGSSSGSSSSNEGKGQKEEMEITWLNILHTASPPTDTVLNQIESKTNTKIKFSWIPDASKEERINTSLASDSLADIVTLTILENSSVRNALKSGVFWDVEKYLEEFPNLKAISEDTRVSASIDGKIYGIPFQKDLARGGVVIRKDWLDHLSLSVPKTMDELMNVAKAFTEDDPDGNGKDDTTGFIDRNVLSPSFKTLSSYFGTPNKWEVDNDGNFIAEFESDGYIETMDYMKTLYDNGWINKDFAVTAKTDQQKGFAEGKAGIYVGALFDSKNLKNMAKGIQDDMELVVVNDITSESNPERAIWAEGSNGVGGLLAFPHSEVKDEKELKRLLKFINDLMDPEIYTLMTYGIEGRHYEINDDGAYEIINQDLWQQEVQPFAASRPKESGYGLKDSDPLKAEADKLIAENAEYAVLNPAVSLESPMFTTQGTELEKIIIDATYQYILGEIDLDGFKKAVKNWNKQGGKTIKEEYKEAYKATVK
ncbi:extracellular solute-binding protein [Lederbergia sp. NSJ-179]|uniref:extracellular solute-binding protein n=1 Tax=Lederbergia sp. NSJ-179 TaxID=2931402 RepID=UPI001FD4248D|nr:extracellular solute-binding protein [Lederbergia sp. NSJ-179]MCJ7843192.1 extracellular solute-binding protein [Lederbergia sp. NSJ-179]